MTSGLASLTFVTIISFIIASLADSNLKAQQVWGRLCEHNRDVQLMS
jgi:hypothetical protein